MSTRIDQRNGKGQPQNHQNAAGSTPMVRQDEIFDYSQSLQQSQAAQYPSMQMASQSAGDSYYNGYYPMNYPTNYFTDPNNWGTTTSDSYLGYGQEYMQFPSGFDYSQGMGAFNWLSYDDYSNWGGDSQQQLGMMGYNNYSGAYSTSVTAAESVNSSFSQPRTTSYLNGSDFLPSASASGAAESTGTSELENGMMKVSINGATLTSAGGDMLGQEPLSDSPLHETTPTSSSSSNGPSNTSTTSNCPPASAQPSKPMSWANVAKQPAKPAPKPPVVTPALTTAPSAHQHQQQQRRDGNKPSSDSAWDNAHKNQTSNNSQRSVWSAPRTTRPGNSNSASASNGSIATPAVSSASESATSAAMDPTLSKLKQTNNYNPKSFDLTARNARFFVIKSYSEDDIHRAIKYGVWCSTEHGNKRLDNAFREREGKGPIYLFYSVNGSGHFCGMAQMMSGVDYQTHAGVWTQDKWKGSMEIKWIYVKDVPNNQLRHIRLENNENKPVTNSRDTQEVPNDKGKQVLKIFHTYRHTTSIFDDFGHYERKEEETGDTTKRKLANGARN